MKTITTIDVALGSVGISIPDILTRTWEELDYRLDVCRATSGANIKKLQTQKKVRIYSYTI